MNHKIDAEIEIEVLFFAGAAEVVGHKRLRLTVQAGESLGELSKRLEDCYPGLRRWSHSGRWAINEAFCELSTVLESPCTIAFIPPVSGG
ncbi:MAG: MoaD/ThiS family protein [Planctomycetales bacterium]|nr:MoaD/ThiS family protein [Planctomycetales bacterium]